MPKVLKLAEQSRQNTRAAQKQSAARVAKERQKTDAAQKMRAQEDARIERETKRSIRAIYRTDFKPEVDKAAKAGESSATLLLATACDLWGPRVFAEFAKQLPARERTIVNELPELLRSEGYKVDFHLGVIDHPREAPVDDLPAFPAFTEYRFLLKLSW